MQSHASTMQHLSMQRRHFQMIAETLKSLTRGRPDDWSKNGWRETCLTFASRLASTNPGFDRARFLAACGME
jgi:hypothetical protein